LVVGGFLFLFFGFFFVLVVGFGVFLLASSPFSIGVFLFFFLGVFAMVFPPPGLAKQPNRLAVQVRLATRCEASVKGDGPLSTIINFTLNTAFLSRRILHSLLSVYDQHSRKNAAPIFPAPLQCSASCLPTLFLFPLLPFLFVEFSNGFDFLSTSALLFLGELFSLLCVFFFFFCKDDSFYPQVQLL